MTAGILHQRVLGVNHRAPPPARFTHRCGATDGALGVDAAPGGVLMAIIGAAPPFRRMRFSSMVQIMCAVLFLALPPIAAAAGGEPARHTGHIQSVRPSDGMLFIEEPGGNGVSRVLKVCTRSATVVRLWRDPADPWTWRQDLTSIYRWPVGTFVVVIGRRIDEGSVEASRIEIPKIMSE